MAFVADAMLRSELLARIRDNYDAIRVELRREAGLQ
jgi:hypothetical protein